MKNGYIEPSGADTLMGIYSKIDVVSGYLNEPLTTDEAVLIFCIAKSIREGKAKELRNEDKTEKFGDVLAGKAVKCPLCHNFMVDDFGFSVNYCKNCCSGTSIREGKVRINDKQ